MIVWGSRVTHKVIATGQFYCPGCTQHCSYRLIRPKKWGCVYWMPIVPLQDFEPFVVCGSCNQAYPETALQQDAASAQRQFQAQREAEGNLARMLCEVMALMAGEKTNPSPRLFDLIANAGRRLLKINMAPADIYAAITSGPDDPEAVLRDVEQQAGSLTDRGKELVLRAAIVAAPKPLTQSKLALAVEIGRRLGMTAEQVNGTIADFANK